MNNLTRLGRGNQDIIINRNETILPEHVHFFKKFYDPGPSYNCMEILRDVCPFCNHPEYNFYHNTRTKLFFCENCESHGRVDALRDYCERNGVGRNLLLALSPDRKCSTAQEATDGDSY